MTNKCEKIFQKIFHQYPSDTIDSLVWKERYKKAIVYLEKKGILRGEILPELTFTRRGLLHGDSPNYILLVICISVG